MPQKLHERDIFTNTHVQIDRSLFAPYGTYATNYSCVFGDFYALWTQDAGITKITDCNNINNDNDNDNENDKS